MGRMTPTEVRRRWTDEVERRLVIPKRDQKGSAMSDIEITFQDPPKGTMTFEKLQIGDLFGYGDGCQVFIKTAMASDDNTREIERGPVRQSGLSSAVIPLAGELRVWPKQA